MLSHIKRSLPYNMPVRKYWGQTKGVIASLINKNALKGIDIVGITGTDGKTTTTAFCGQLLQILGVPTAMMSSETHSINGKTYPNKTKRSTASPFEIYNFIKKAKKEGCKIVILEVSSHAIEQGRTYGIEFDYSIVTNLSQEHLDYHGNMEEYAKSKAKLFLKTKKCAIIPRDLNEKELFLKCIKTDVIETFVGDNLINKNVIISRNMRFANHGTYFDLYFKDEIIKNIFLPVIGHFNVDNLLYAIALVSLIKIEKPTMTLIEAIGKLEKVPGRLDDLHYGQNFRIWISYAVTPQALEKTLKYAQSVKNELGKVWVVYGATGGQHDKGKRPIMGEISGIYADMSIITDDETYGEDSMLIINDVLKGLRGTQGEHLVIQDRLKAIHYVLKNARRGDILIICGMGNFDTRNIGGIEEKWSDKGAVEDYYKLTIKS